MNEEKLKLIKRAKKKYKRIYPLSGHKNFEKCFTEVKGKLHFWFNLRTGSTSMMVQEDESES